MHYLGLDVHKDSIAVAIAPGDSTEVRHYGIIGGTLDVVDKLVAARLREETTMRVAWIAENDCG